MKINRKPEPKKILLIVAVAISCALAFALATVAIHGSVRHQLLSEGVELFQRNLSSVEESAIIERTDGCRRAEEKVGKGFKHCHISVRATKSLRGVDDANDMLNSFHQATTGIFATINPLPKEIVFRGNPDYTFGSATYRHEQTGRLCAVDYEYDSRDRTEGQLVIVYECDNTSWFARTFQGSNAIF